MVNNRTLVRLYLLPPSLPPSLETNDNFAALRRSGDQTNLMSKAESTGDAMAVLESTTTAKVSFLQIV